MAERAILVRLLRFAQAPAFPGAILAATGVLIGAALAAIPDVNGVIPRRDAEHPTTNRPRPARRPTQPVKCRRTPPRIASQVDTARDGAFESELPISWKHAVSGFPRRGVHQQTGQTGEMVPDVQELHSRCSERLGGLTFGSSLAREALVDGV